jgi:hypothetical protein
MRPDLIETAVQDAIPTESYGNFGLVEPAFARFLGRFDRYLDYRGRDAADAEIKLLSTVHKLGKLLDHRWWQPAAT